MDKDKIKIGDILKVQKGIIFSSVFDATVKRITQDLLGKVYICNWGVHDLEYNIHYSTSGKVRPWQILYKI